MTVNTITSKAQFDALSQSGKVILIDFYANWCGPCRAISPAFEKHAEDNANEGVEFYKVNIDEVEDLAAELGISSIPAFHAYKGGERLGVAVGAVPAKLTALVSTAQAHL